MKIIELFLIVVIESYLFPMYNININKIQSYNNKYYNILPMNKIILLNKVTP